MEIISFIHLGNFGQCGNQLFEIAGVIGLCHRYGAKPAFPADWKYRNEFNIPEEYFKDIIPDYYISGHQKSYNPDLLEKAIKHKVVNITEYLQSEKYFFKTRGKIKIYLTPRGTKDLGEDSVAIHIRRGDYIGHPYFQQLGPEYYLSAISQYFSDRKYKFYVCSDDQDYCRAIFDGGDFIIEERNEIDDLRVIAGCRYHVIANSTFSWWGAYLSNSQLVIRPPKIFAGLYSKIRDEADYWPEDWVINDGLLTSFPNSCHPGPKHNKDSGDKSLVTLRKITDTIILNASFVSNPGLIHGKMGICIYLYHFSRITGNKIYEDYAGELLDDIFASINDKTPYDFENGLAGIGWGIEYLVRNDFVEADTDEVLSEIDQILSEKIGSASCPGLSILTGNTGIGIYFLSRIKKADPEDNGKSMLKNEHLIVHFINEIEKRTRKLNKPHGFYNGGISMFDLSWDYPALICLMTEIYELNILREKVGNIILKLLSTLKKEDNLPRQYVNMVLMLMVMEKLKKCQNSFFEDNNSSVKAETSDRIKENLNAIPEMISANLLTRLDRLVFENEMEALIADCSKFQYGAIWLYRKMFDLQDLQDENDPTLWQTITQKLRNQVARPEWFDRHKTDKHNSMGLVDGLSGVGIHLLYPA